MPRVKPGDRVRFPLTPAADPDPSGSVVGARWAYLVRLAELYPAVLEELYAIGASEGAAFDVWARRWRLTDPWCRAYAAATVRAWAVYKPAGLCWFDRDDAIGLLVPVGAVPPRPDLKEPHHFDWLIKFQRGATYSSLAPRARVRKSDELPYTRIDAVTVQQACHRLADLMGLTLRPTRRGRPSLFR